jgi:DNA topoisomerase I
MKNLVVVESPTKAKTIGKFLGSDYEIRASMGHIMDLPKSTLGVDVEHNFEPQYEVVDDKKKTIAELKTLSKEAENIILATDPDREGEAIAAHVKDVLAQDPSSAKASAGKQKFSRIVFHEITKEAIEEAIKNPREIDVNLVDAQTARRVLDRLVGYKISPVLWQKVRRGLSAGRVQSVALRLIVEREKEIEKFKKEKYYTISALVDKDSKEIEFELVEINGEKVEFQSTINLYDGDYKYTKTTIGSLEQAKDIVSKMSPQNFTVLDVLKKESKRSPLPPFTTSTLQQEASRRYGFAGRRTMSLAQKLYEEGFITYHRTDSVVVSAGAINSIRGYVEKSFGGKYLPEKPKLYSTKQKLAQEAHEAIRPTKVAVLGEEITTELGRDFGRVYELIWKRAIASQMSDAIIESTTILTSNKQQLTANTENVSSPARLVSESVAGRQKSEVSSYLLKANGSVLLFDGFLKLTPQALNDKLLPDFTVSDKLNIKNIQDIEHETQPPPRYNDASLIATLEEKGIGRPSTYAAIVSTIEARNYIEREDARFTPTSVGVAVNDFLVKNFSTIDDIPFTAEMEDGLDQIASGDKEWVPFMKSFYVPFEKTLEGAKDTERVKIEVEETSEKCPECGQNLVIRLGRFGKFLSCGAFPKCKFTKPFVEETKFTCPKCGGKIIFKKPRKGRKFYGCSSYPACAFAAWKVEDIKKEQGLEKK